MKTGRPKGLAIGSLLQMIKDMAPSSNFNDDIRPEVGPNETLTCPICLPDHWTQCAAQLCVPTVFASGYVAVSHLPVLAAISAVLTTPTSEKPA